MGGVRERILVADDHQENVKFILEAILKPHGFQPLTAFDGTGALQIASKEKPDLILLDLQMPKMDGLQVLEALQSQGLRIPVILMTFHGSEEIAVKGFRMGARDYVIKPFTVQELLTAIEGALMESRLRRERDALTDRLVQANQQLERRLREMRTLYAIGQSVISVLDLQELFQRILEAVLYLSPAETTALLLTQEGGPGLRLAAERQREQGRSRHPGEFIQAPEAPLTLQFHRALIAEPTRETGAGLFVPMEVGGRPIGVLAAAWPAKGPLPTDHYIQLLGSLAGYAAIAIENARGFERLEQIKEQAPAGLPLHAAPAVLQRLQASSELWRPAGTRQEVSVLCAGWRGLGGLGERLAPAAVFELLNRYTSLLAEIIFQHEGVVEQLQTGELVALFNAPLIQSDHAWFAAEAALEMHLALARFHRQLSPELRLGIGIGVSSGEALLGVIDTYGMQAYASLGEPREGAWQLQALAEAGQILISEGTLQRIYDRVQTRSRGNLSLRGRPHESRYFELLPPREI